jgi:hypothetical protein
MRPFAFLAFALGLSLALASTPQPGVFVQTASQDGLSFPLSTKPAPQFIPLPQGATLWLTLPEAGQLSLTGPQAEAVNLNGSAYMGPRNAQGRLGLQFPSSGVYHILVQSTEGSLYLVVILGQPSIHAQAPHQTPPALSPSPSSPQPAPGPGACPQTVVPIQPCS